MLPRRGIIDLGAALYGLDPRGRGYWQIRDRILEALIWAPLPHENRVRGQYGTPKSRRASRAVPLADRVAGELDRHFQRSAFQHDDDLVFAHPATGGPLDPSKILCSFGRFCSASRTAACHFPARSSKALASSSASWNSRLRRWETRDRWARGGVDLGRQEV